MNIILDRTVPFYLEYFFDHTDETLLRFKDILTVGPSSYNPSYDPIQRYRFWNDFLIEDQRMNISFDNFLCERKKYNQVKMAIKNKEIITIWISDNPNDILLLWSLSADLYQHFQSRYIYLGYYPNISDLQVIKKNPIDDHEITEYSHLWKSYVEYRTLKYKIHVPYCQQVAIVLDAIQYLHPSYGNRILYLAKIDIDILNEISKYHFLSAHEIIGRICCFNKWIGDCYVFSRLDILEKEIGIIESVAEKNSNIYNITKIGSKILANGIIDNELQKKYISCLYCHPVLVHKMF
ncbi:MAG: DUF1835 domain-containing protein [Bacteroidales bacterium]|jgi:hypothetical protein|nr:DUF1835 domain-containing protein [Bacteroidales bacterium]